MKRIVSLVLAVSMILSCFVSVFAASTYSDLTGENAKYASAVAALSELKVGDWAVIQGYTDGTFQPQKEVTRAELAKMLVVCLGLGEEVESLAGKTVFSDVPSTYWGAGFINAAAQSKIIVGYPDGEFKPEKTVTYAEAFTMALRALGYGNVADFEGTWPTAYMQKAVELRLNKDMDTYKTDAAALRGNIAIMLWNMLRTPMWRVYEESEGTGMTLANTGELMLNVKFPDYYYADKAYVDRVDIDEDEVTVTLHNDKDKEVLSAFVTDLDLSRLIIGSKVSGLVKDYKDADKATFVALVRENTVVEGVVSKVKDDGKFEVEGTEYKLDSKIDPATAVIAEDDYVVFEAEGKRVLPYANNYTDDGEAAVLKVLPRNGSRYASKAATAKSAIGEDALVILDGVWTDRDAIDSEVVYAKMEEFDGDPYWMVVSDTIKGSFEALTYEKKSENRMFVTVDGTDYRTFDDILKGNVKYGKDNNKDAALTDLTVEEKKNDFYDKDVIMYVNFLGQVVRMEFGDVTSSGTGSFYAVVSNGVQLDSSRNNRVWIQLVNADNAADAEDTDNLERTYFKKSFSIDDFVGTALESNTIWSNKDSADDVDGIYAWVEFEGDEIKNIEVLRNGLAPEQDGSAYDDDYSFVSFNKEIDDDNFIKATDDNDYRVSTSTKVYVLTPVDDEDDLFDHFKFTVAEDPLKALDGVENGLIAYKADSTIAKAEYVFVTDEAESSELFFSYVDGIQHGTNGNKLYLTELGEYVEVEYDAETKVNSDEDLEAMDGAIIAYTQKDSGKIKVREVLREEDLPGAGVVLEADDADAVIWDGTQKLQVVADKEPDKTTYEKTTFVKYIVGVKDEVVDFSELCTQEAVIVGIKEGISLFKVGDRVVVGKELDSKGNPKVVAIIEVDGVDEKDALEVDDDEVVVIRDAVDPDDLGGDDTPTPTPTPVPDEDTKFAVTFAWATEDGLPDGAELPADQEVESGDELSFALPQVDGYIFTADHENGEVVTADMVVTISFEEDNPPVDTFTVTYAFDEEYDWLSADLLPQDATVEAGAPYTVETLSDITVTSGDEAALAHGYVSGDVISFVTEPSGDITVEADVNVSVSIAD